MVRSSNYEKPPAGRQSDLIDDAGELLLAALRLLAIGTGLLLWWSVLFPWLSLPVYGSVALGWWQGWPYGVAAGCATVAGWGVWWWRWPRSFDRWVSQRVRQRFWRWFRYTSRWEKLMAMQRLTAELNTQVLTPPVYSVRVGRVVDVLEVGLLHGQKVETWEARSEELRHSFRAFGFRVRHTVSGRVRLEVIHTDLLRRPVPLPRVVRPAGSVDLEAVVVGMTQLGRAWPLALLGTHVLVAGATGAGKGSVAWSAIAGLGPAIAEGSVIVWVIDPKGGAEFGLGMNWFDRFAYDNTTGALDMLREAVRVMRARLEMIRTTVRKVTPSTRMPMIFLIIDEAASLTEYYADKKIKEEIERLLGLILTMGRAAAVVVMGCMQDPSKEVMRQRQLYPTRVGLRLDEATQVPMIFGPSGRDRGALCDLISRKTPGVGYVQITPGADLTDENSNQAEELAAEIERVRAFHVTDDDIRWIMATYRPPRRYTGDIIGS